MLERSRRQVNLTYAVVGSLPELAWVNNALIRLCRGNAPPSKQILCETAFILADKSAFLWRPVANFTSDTRQHLASGIGEYAMFRNKAATFYLLFAQRLWLLPGVQHEDTRRAQFKERILI